MKTLLLLGLAACAHRSAPPPAPIATQQHDGDTAPAEPTPMNISKMWNFQNPAESEGRFLAAANEADGDSRLQLLTQAARAQGLQRRYEDAHATLDGVEAAITPNMPGARMRLLLERGRLHRSSGAVAASRPFFEEAWTLGCAVGLDALSIDAAHMVAIVVGGEEGMAWNERALDIALRSDEPDAKNWLGSLTNNLGWDYFNTGNHLKALELWQAAAAWHAERNTGRGERIARWTVARGLRALDRFDEALEMQRQLLADLEGIGESDGYVHEELGELLLALGRPAEAASQFARAHELLSKETWLVEKEPARFARMLELATP